ncbi:MAG: enoyl-CoA hydratase-related protein, partial [Thermoanaerobaculia bacterium]|nr:enoyl-CoA hydratase-related protein [Thermoanaerobaculia bacterium]
VGTMREDLTQALHEASETRSVRAIVITGAGRGFSAGGDIDFMQDLQERKEILEFTALLSAGASIVTKIRDIPQPVIASVNGVAAGAGLNLALACDMRIASETARFSASFVKIGLHPDWGGTYFLPRLVGASRAMELMMTGRLIEADEAWQIGLVDRVVPHERLMEVTTKLAKAIAYGPPIAIQNLKRAVYESENNELRMQIRLETENQIRAFVSSDATEGLKAFREKRKPRFRGE